MAIEHVAARRKPLACAAHQAARSGAGVGLGVSNYEVGELWGRMGCGTISGDPTVEERLILRIFASNASDCVVTVPLPTARGKELEFGKYGP